MNSFKKLFFSSGILGFNINETEQINQYEIIIKHAIDKVKHRYYSSNYRKKIKISTNRNPL